MRFSRMNKISLYYRIAHRNCVNTVSESASKAGTGRKVPWCPRKLEQHLYCTCLFVPNAGLSCPEMEANFYIFFI